MSYTTTEIVCAEKPKELYFKELDVGDKFRFKNYKGNDNVYIVSYDIVEDRKTYVSLKTGVKYSRDAGPIIPIDVKINWRDSI